MNRIRRILDRLIASTRQRGSALLVSLMVMVGLSLLGLAFVAVSETENAISINERNHAQTVAVAEAGAKLVVQWFQEPSTMVAQALEPTNENAIKINRTIDTGGTQGYYKTSGYLCDTPYGPKPQDLFYGTETSPDILINATTLAASSTQADFLTDLNTKLFGGTENGEITELRIFAPPIVGGTTVTDDDGNKFVVGGQRFGTATIKSTAQKKDLAGNVISQAVCRIVVGPFPLPGPTGAIQAIGSVGNDGNFDVHWGSVESEVAVSLTKSGLSKASIPWFDAWDIAHIERGYDSSSTWTANTAYIGNTTFPRGDVVRPTSAAPVAAQTHEYVAMQNGSGTSSGTEPTWPTDDTSTVTDGGVTWKRRPKTMYPLKDADATNYDNHKWFYEVLGRSIEDPWFSMRSWSTVTGGIGGNAFTGSAGSPHPFPYAQNPVPTSWGGSNWFQNQTFSSRPDYKKVEVPRFDYDVWKAAALAGRGQPGVHYLYPSGGNWTDGVTTQSMGTWIATGNGFYFFETTNLQNPQNGGTGSLSSGATPCGFKGFLYMNATALPTGGGCSGTTGYYPQPGEPYRDNGYRKVAEETAGTQVRGQWATDASGNYVVVGAYDGKWDYQDLDWSNTDTDGSSTGTKNSLFDVFVAQRTVKRESDSTTHTEWVPVEYYPGCHPGNNSTCATCTCSEPHEPYMNLLYNAPNSALSNSGGGSFNAITIGWDDPANAGRAKRTSTDLPSGSLVACAAADVASITGQTNCTSNVYDDGGGMAQIDMGVEGVIYNEGSYDGTGNTDFFGSLVLGTAADPKGTPRIWYDERLVKGGWPPKGVNFPRVMITSEQVQ